MSDKSDTGDTSKPDEPLPHDAVCAAEAAEIACMSTTTLRRHAVRGRFRQWGHPERTGYWYSRSEMEQERAKFRRLR